MIELMLKLLTYEPYEKVSGNEKDYIDKVLSENITSSTAVTNKGYIIYDGLFRGFMDFLNYSSTGRYSVEFLRLAERLEEQISSC